MLSDSTGRTALAVLVVVAATALAWAGLSCMQTSAQVGWLFVVTTCAFAASELLRQAAQASDSIALLSCSTLVALVAYGAVGVFAHLMVRAAAPQSAKVLWADAAFVCTGSALAAWLYLIGPAAGAFWYVQSVVGLVFVAIDALLVALVVQLTVRPVGRIPAFWLMLTAVILMLFGDLGRGLGLAGYIDGGAAQVSDLLQLLAFCLLASLCLHPSAGQLLRANERRRTERPQPARMALSYLALIGPTLVLMEDRSASSTEHGARTLIYAILISAVFVRMYRSANALNRLQRATRERADRDDLTGLLNRSATERALQDRLSNPTTPQTVLFIDLDRFKPINDTWGHAAGDLVLREAAARLRSAAGPSATVGRMGGDEFVIGIDQPHRARTETAIKAAFEIPFLGPGGVPLSMSCSIGSASGTHEPVDHLLLEADHAMYSSKRGAQQPSGDSGKPLPPARNDRVETAENGPTAAPAPTDCSPSKRHNRSRTGDSISNN